MASTSETFGVASVGSAALVGSAMDRLLPEVARAGAAGQFRSVPLRHRNQRRRVGTADVPCLLAPRVERTALGHLEQVGRQTLDRVEVLALLVQPRDRVEQAAGVGVGG